MIGTDSLALGVVAFLIVALICVALFVPYKLQPSTALEGYQDLMLVDTPGVNRNRLVLPNAVAPHSHSPDSRVVPPHTHNPHPHTHGHETPALEWQPEFRRGATKELGQFLIRDPKTDVRLYLETDGNMCLYAGPIRQTHPTWCTMTQNKSVARATFMEDGNVALLNGTGDVVWSTGTNALSGSSRGASMVPVGGPGMRSGVRILNARNEIVWQSS
jgi:hypothetical protein